MSLPECNDARVVHACTYTKGGTHQLAERRSVERAATRRKGRVGELDGLVDFEGKGDTMGYREMDPLHGGVCCSLATGRREGFGAENTMEPA